MENSKQETQVARVPKLVVFITTQKKLAVIGINPALVQQPYPFDWKMLMPLLSQSVSVL